MSLLPDPLSQQLGYMCVCTCVITPPSVHPNVCSGTCEVTPASLILILCTGVCLPPLLAFLEHPSLPVRALAPLSITICLLAHTQSTCKAASELFTCPPEKNQLDSSVYIQPLLPFVFVLKVFTQNIFQCYLGPSSSNSMWSVTHLQ